MPLNIPNGTKNNISFGPARILMDVWTPNSTANTPNTDVGYIGEDGVTIELNSEKKNIKQGNPQLTEFSFVTAQDAKISFTSIEWNFESFRLALGAGTTGMDDGFGNEFFSFGGNPLNTFCAMQIQHQMAVTGDTLYANIWKVQSESGFSLPFGSEEHSFEYAFQAVRARTDWGGNDLLFDQQLLRLSREEGVQQYG